MGLCNSLANCSLKFNGISTPLPDTDLSLSEADFLSKSLYIVEARHLWYPSYLGFLAILSALSLKILSEMFFFLNF